MKLEKIVEVYLDNSSTTKQYNQVTDLMSLVMRENYGNPSSLHRLGMSAEKIVKNARVQVSKAMGVNVNEIIFTSGGTESDNLAILGGTMAKRRSGKKIITTKIEHPAVLETFKKLEKEGFKAVYIDVDKNGLINLEQLKSEIDDETILISVMQVNNEIGTIQPLEKIAFLKKDALFHSDCVQSLGKLSMQTKGVDMLSISGHKIHGPKGIGALYLKKGTNLIPHMTGGGQEKNMRSGTENTPAIAGFGLATEMATVEINNRVEKMKSVINYLKKGIEEQIKDVKINTPAESSVASVLNVSFLGTRGEVILHTLEQDGIYVSTGSACSSNKKGQSHVLKAIGLNDREIEGAIRFSCSEFNSKEEIDYVLDKLKTAVNEFRKLGSFR